MSANLAEKTIPQLRKYARAVGVLGYSKYTRKNNLVNFIARTMKNRGIHRNLLEEEKEEEDEQVISRTTH